MAGIAVLFSCIIWSCDYSNHPSVSFQAGKQEIVQSYGSSLIENLPIPGLSVVIINKDSIFYQSFGSASLSQEKTTTLENSTPMFTGNISPIMVITGILNLAQQGKIKLDDPVVKHLPYFTLAESFVSPMTIHHLMSQTGGIPVHQSIWDQPDFSADALSRTTQSIRFQTPEFYPAGSRVKRSAYNFDILADLIAKVSKMDFEDYMKTSILKPLDMNSSFFMKASNEKDKVALPHKITNPLSYQIDTVGIYPANREHSGSIGFHSSAEDLASWMYMLLHDGRTTKGEKFLSKKFTELAFTSLPIDSNTGIGYGWEITESKEGKIYEQGSKMGGFTSHILMNPKEQIGVALISNIASDFDLSPLCWQFIYWLKNGGELPKVQPLLAKTLGKKFLETKSIDKVMESYDLLKVASPKVYDYSLPSVSQLGVNLLYKASEPQAAIQLYTEILKRFPKDPEAYLNLAESYYQVKQWSGCKENLEYAKQLLSDKSTNPDLQSRIQLLQEAILEK